MSDQVQQVKTAVDIVQVIGERVHLSRAGKNFKGLCPFHSEKTPSFFVTPDLQRYKCFGCGKSGDVLTFLQEFDSLTFAEALQTVADRVGIQLEKHQFSKEDQERKRWFEVLHLAQEYYHYVLTSHKQGELGRQYLKDRGITNETIETFHVGYAPESWDALQKYLIDKKQYTEQELLAVGLVAQSRQSIYDRFRNRLIFPLTDHRGNVVGFSGRLLDSAAKEAKYINSPETPLYHKSELLFGYSVLHKLIRDAGEVIVMEGEFDVLSSYQAGVKHVVAIKGSALTPQHVKLLARSVKKIILSLDADSAGITATKRAIEVVRPFDIPLRVLPVVGGKDPDEIAKQSPKSWRELAKSSVSAYEYLLNAAFADKNSNTGEGKHEITKELVSIFAQIENVIEQNHYIVMAAEKLGVKTELLETELNKFLRRQPLSRQDTSKKLQEKKPDGSRLEKLELQILTLLLHMDKSQLLARLAEIQHLGFSTSPASMILEKLIASLLKPSFDLPKFLNMLPEELKPTATDLYLTDLQDDPDELEKEWTNTIAVFLVVGKTSRRKSIAIRLKTLEEQETLTKEEQQEFDNLQTEFVRLSNQ